MALVLADTPTIAVISVIVPALNESTGIARCLTALQRQSMPAHQFEILVMDNGSTDGTVDIARQFTPHVHTFPGVAIGALRNEGARLARGSVLAFIDADCVASRTWLEGAVAALADGGAAVGNKYDLPPDGGWIEAAWLGGVAPGRWQAHELWTGNLIVARETFLACGGFDETLVSYEDVALSHALRSKGPLFCDDRVRVTHVGGPRTLLEFARQQLWHGFEEWTVFGRGIARDSFAPALVCLVGYLLVPVGVLVELLVPVDALVDLRVAAVGVAAVSVAAVGLTLVIAASLWHLARQLRGIRSRSPGAVIGLAVLNVVSISARGAAIAIRALGLQWSGRRKTINRAASACE